MLNKGISQRWACPLCRLGFRSTLSWGPKTVNGIHTVETHVHITPDADDEAKVVCQDEPVYDDTYISYPRSTATLTKQGKTKLSFILDRIECSACPGCGKKVELVTEALLKENLDAF